MYGLETIVLNTKVVDKLNAFQMKGLRTITTITTTHVNRANTNAAVFTTVNNKLAELHRKPMVPLTDYHKKCRITYLIKLMNEGEHEPGTGVTFDKETLKPIDK